MKTIVFDYHLPQELIAQKPLPRGDSRLLVLHRETGNIEHRQFSNLLDYVRAGDTLVLNDTRVVARRLETVRPSGGTAEVLLLHPVGDREWRALIRPARRFRIGDRLPLFLDDGLEIVALIAGVTDDGARVLRFESQTERDRLASAGMAPLPPYIESKLEDEERYQTVFSRHPGSAAAPTAGLHFTDDILRQCEKAAVGIAKVTLHVGVDTFRPVRVSDLEDHKMHGEWFEVSAGTAERISSTLGRIIAVGTTVVRTLESAAVGPHQLRELSGETRLFIMPGFAFRITDGILTNFHLPKSTLLALVSAFAGHELIMEAYRQAIALRYRFYSFGDAMLIV